MNRTGVRMLQNWLRPITRIFKPERNVPFVVRPPIEISLPAESASALNKLKARYRIQISIPAEPLEVSLERGQYLISIEGEPATGADAIWHIPLLAEEFGCYPPLLVENTRLTRIVLCGELFRSQKLNPAAKRFVSCTTSDCPPLLFQHQPCCGVPDAKEGILYLAIACGRDDPEYVRELIHHEFYHCVQWQQFGSAGDSKWAALNSPDFVYGPGGLAANYGPDPTFWVLPAEEWGNGFLNQYSMSAPEEDQAEIFAHMLTKPASVHARIRADDILLRKVERLKATLKLFCSDVDEAFWEGVTDSRMPFDL